MESVVTFFGVLFIIYILMDAKSRKTSNDVIDPVPKTQNVLEEEYPTKIEELSSEYIENNIQSDFKYTLNIQIMKDKLQEKDVEINNLANQLELFRNELNACQETLKTKDMFVNQLLTEVMMLGKAQMAKSLPSSCIGKLTDVYEIKVPGIKPFSVPCDSKLAGSGWTVIQRRQDGSTNFNRNWIDYRLGFGDLNGEFFIGLEKLHLLTKSQMHELYIHLEDFKNEQRYARYSEFGIGNEAESFELKLLGNYSGDAGDSFGNHKNMKFSTPENDVDEDSQNCADKYKSGWWFKNCYTCNLNGLYATSTSGKNNQPGIMWNSWHLKSMKFVQIMIRPKLN